MSFKVYWNNVCLLSTREEKFINNSLKESKKENSIIFEYYGLGRKMGLKEKIIEDLSDGTIEADLVISTDLDIFQSKNLIPSKSNELSNIKDLLPLRTAITNSNIVEPSGIFAPFIIIPLIFVVNKNLIPEEKIPYSFEQLLDPYYKNKIAFGGIHNSAGRSLIKSIWYLYGRQKAEEFVTNSIITSMPAAAFKKTMTGEAAISIVPTIFAMRSGINNIVAIWPKEGAVAIPSYYALKKDSDSLCTEWVLHNILGKSHQELLKSAGAVIPCDPDIDLPDLAKENNCSLLYPDWSFLHNFDDDYFYSLCKKHYEMII
ncbi:ABC transporter substrate-binding protein [Paramaledivibacter caminithermalis]|jgi:ABC-type Fe3+ transport system substrate-binding protein|uniref:ABC-type Fe3+ transport system, substrate-binding protein n=1 Tax=Paramaledivibacter caminithermalis (strain DSM 15212 / CIP 107654 / DViRD3) TaxID=1121301 RepID=A0A1M6P272_PARC5|nr:ABC transporter substrate-binding protein [Paramaledivibacter caminithermalis]SHK02107.1 ABC-type Fe3+ transport system, substrate-binding protein [Paramaledivibacter caminithermalis DSM 15212]